MNITPLVRTDLLAADASHAEALAAIHAAACPPGEHWSTSAIAALLAVPGTFGLLDAAGGMVLARVAADQAELLTLAVVPAIRRTGRARTLLAAAEAQAATAGACTMFLEVVASNAPAYALYTAAGYRRIGLRCRYYKDGGDALLLSKPLTPAAATTV